MEKRKTEFFDEEGKYQGKNKFIECGMCGCNRIFNELAEATEEGLCDHCYYEWSGQGNLMKRRWDEHENGRY